MNGTSIQDLRKSDELTRMSYNAMQNSQYELGHNAAHTIQQAQHAPYYSSTLQAPMPTQLQAQLQLNGQPSSSPSMEDLAKDISANMPPEPTSAPEHLELEEEVFEVNNGGKLSFIPSKFREPLILLVVFVILSQPAVRTTLGRYIKQINPGVDGNVSLLGIVIYGIILATMYVLAKKLLLS